MTIALLEKNISRLHQVKDEYVKRSQEFDETLDMQSRKIIQQKLIKIESKSSVEIERM